MDKLIGRLVVLLICHRIGVKRYQRFRFAGQDNDSWYFFGRTTLWKQTDEEYHESRLGLNYLLSAAAKEVE